MGLNQVVFIHSADSSRFPSNFAVAVESAVKAESGVVDPLRQTIPTIAGDSEATGAGEQPVVVVAVADGAAGVSEACNLEVVVVRVGKDLAKGAAPRLGGDQLAVVGIAQRLASFFA